MAEAMRLLDITADQELTCVYCPAPAATWDHLYNNVVKGRFSGYGNQVFNLVPACRSCNEQKGGKHWLAFLHAKNPKDLDARAARLLAFERAANIERFGWDEIETQLPELAREYVALQEQLRGLLTRADDLAGRIRELIVANRARVRATSRR